MSSDLTFFEAVWFDLYNVTKPIHEALTLFLMEQGIDPPLFKVLADGRRVLTVAHPTNERLSLRFGFWEAVNGNILRMKRPHATLMIERHGGRPTHPADEGEVFSDDYLCITFEGDGPIDRGVWRVSYEHEPFLVEGETSMNTRFRAHHPETPVAERLIQNRTSTKMRAETVHNLITFFFEEGKE